MKKKIIITLLAVFIASATLLAACSLNNDCCSSIPGSASDPSFSTSSGKASVSSKSAAGEGILSSFRATDLDDNAVDQSVFKGKKLTMVNIWATFCGPCISEMPELAQLNKEYADKGVQVVGIPVDVIDWEGNISGDMADAAKEIISKTGADYLHIYPSESLIKAKLGQVSSVPETIFVDENGRQVGKSYIGARSKEQWKAIIDQLLEQVK